MKIYYYKGIDSEKISFTNAKHGYEIQEVSWLGSKVKAIVAHRKSDDLIIPAWCIAPQSKYLLDGENNNIES